MNIYLRELKAHRKGLFFWCLAMVFLVASGIAKFNAYQTNGQSIATLVNQFPHSVQVIFGISGFDLSKVSGYYGVLFLYIALTGALHAVLLGSEIIAKEERDRTSEFLFVRPISRIRVITIKLLAGLTNLIILNLATFLSSIYFVNYFSKGVSITGYISWLMLGLFLLQLIFFSFGAAMAGVIKKPRLASSISASVLMITLILMFIINFNESLDKLKFMTPFKYFDAQVILSINHIEPVYIFLSVMIVGISIFGTYHFYTRRDLRV